MSCVRANSAFLRLKLREKERDQLGLQVTVHGQFSKTESTRSERQQADENELTKVVVKYKNNGQDGAVRMKKYKNCVCVHQG